MKLNLVVKQKLYKRNIWQSGIMRSCNRHTPGLKGGSIDGSVGSRQMELRFYASLELLAGKPKDYNRIPWSCKYRVRGGG